jgi:4-amino-4-deoxy-L-arabinose transferase-like glycosyltransferase
VAGVAAALVVVLAVTSNGYGYHRDELYFRLLGRHLAWGFVDQPPLTPALARLSTAIFGDHLWALRVPSLVCAALMAIGCALICSEIGGGAAAQTLAALGAAAAYPLIGGHLMSTASVDVVVWLAVILFMLRALLRDEPKWWLAAGVATGIGSYNKLLIFLLLLCVGAGLLVSDRRRLLVSRWLWLGLAIAVVIGAPNFIYQATHHWPQFSMAHALAQHKGHDARTQFVPLQLLLMGPPILPIWVAGMVTLWRRRASRAIGTAYPIMCVVLLAVAGQPYYTAGLLLALYAVGCAGTVKWFAGRRWRAALVVVAVGSNTVVSAFIALPLLTVATLAATPIPAVNQTVRDQIGWPSYVREVAVVYASLPPSDRTQAVVVTGNYGEAGAIALYGPGDGLPMQVYSGQNQLWYLGAPPASATVAVIVGIDDTDWVESQFASCETRGQLDNDVGIDNEEQGRAIRVCRQPRTPWPTLWPEFRHLD